MVTPAHLIFYTVLVLGLVGLWYVWRSGQRPVLEAPAEKEETRDLLEQLVQGPVRSGSAGREWLAQFLAQQQEDEESK